MINTSEDVSFTNTFAIRFTNELGKNKSFVKMMTLVVDVSLCKNLSIQVFDITVSWNVINQKHIKILRI